MVAKVKAAVTSGARYSGVPQKVFMVAASVMPSLHRPKSVIFMCPSLSSIRFSNWGAQQHSSNSVASSGLRDTTEMKGCASELLSTESGDTVLASSFDSLTSPNTQRKTIYKL